MSSLEQIFASFFSKVGEQITDYTQNLMKNIVELKLSLESLKKSSKELNAKASEVEEKIKGLGQNKRKRGIEEWLTRVKSIENEVVELGAQAESEGFIRNLMDCGKVAKLIEDVSKLIEQSQHLDGCGTKGIELLTSTVVGKTLQKNCNKILSLLGTGEVSSIGIYGMGGVGKTTLAKCINNLLVEQSKVHVFWIGVSQEFTIKNLQDKIAYFLGINLLSENDEDIRAVALHEAFSCMKGSILILDDVWKNIDMLKLGCPVSKDCCRLIITTRSLEVCHRFSCQKVIGVKTLDEDEAWKLFIKTLASGEEIELSPRVAKIAKSMIECCGGLPLGIITASENMRSKTSVQTWTGALAELREPVTRHGGIGDDVVFRVLKYSFDRLNDQGKEFNLLQLCFLHCSLYLRSFLARKEVLVERFISEGLMDGSKSRRAQLHQGYSILNKLVSLCLLETRGSSECWEMHDLVRDMALKIKEGKYMVRGCDYSLKEIPKEEEWTEDLEKVSLIHNGIRIIRDGISPDCPKLSTLILYGNPLEVIPDSFFSKMQGLCTLDLCWTNITMLPDSLSEMKSLKALLLESCSNLKTVPYLGKLTALRELNLSYTAIKEMPQGVEELLNLRLLSMVSTHLKRLPRGLLLNFKQLQYLTFPVEMLVRSEEIVILKEVEQFQGRLENVRAFNLFLKSRQHDAFYYQVQVGKFYHDGNEIFGDYDREVYLSKCNLEDEKVLGSRIQSLTIRKCKGLSNCLVQDFQPSNYPSSLVTLIIERCGGIQCVLTNSRESFALFSSLQLIHLEALKDFERLIQKREIGAAPAPAPAPARAVFSSLTMLTIENCNRTRKLGLPVSGIPNLANLNITDCRGIEEIFEDEGRDSITLPKFISLTLYGLPRLQFVCNATMICNSYSFISIFQCPQLMKKMPLQSEPGAPPPPVNREISVEREWWESLEWENPSLPQLLQPFVKFQG